DLVGEAVGEVFIARRADVLEREDDETRDFSNRTRMVAPRSRSTAEPDGRRAERHYDDRGGDDRADPNPRLSAPVGGRHGLERTQQLVGALPAIGGILFETSHDQG